MNKDEIAALIISSMVGIAIFIFILTIIGVFGYE